LKLKNVRWSTPLSFADLCNCVGSVWSTTTRTRDIDASAVSFSVQCLIN